jgi:HlyD family secretion protein
MFRHGQRWAVFMVDHGRARRRPIEVGHQNGEYAEVLAGLQEGERVVLHPGDALSDGSRIGEAPATPD